MSHFKKQSHIKEDTLAIIHNNAILYQSIINKQYLIMAENGTLQIPVVFKEYNFMHFCGFSNDTRKTNYIPIKSMQFYKKALDNTLTLNDIEYINHTINNRDAINTIKEKAENFSVAFAPYLGKANQIYIGVGAVTDTSPYDFMIWSKNHGNDAKGREYGASIALNHGSMTNSRGKRILADFMVPISLRTETKEEVLKHSDNIYKVDYILCRDYVQHNDNKTYTSLIYDTDYKKNHNSHNWDSIFSYLDKNTKLNLNIKGIQLPLAIRYKQSIHKLSEKYELTESEESFFKNIINERQGDRLYPTLALSLYGRYIVEKGISRFKDESFYLAEAIKNSYRKNKENQDIRKDFEIFKADTFKKYIEDTLKNGNTVPIMREYCIPIAENKVQNMMDIDFGVVRMDKINNLTVHLIYRIDENEGEGSLMLVDTSKKTDKQHYQDYMYPYADLNKYIMGRIIKDNLYESIDDFNLDIMDFAAKREARFRCTFPDDIYQNKDKDNYKINDIRQEFIDFVKEEHMKDKDDIDKEEI